MIKICSLDFLNKDFFDTDIMTSDGKILFKSGERITPELLLQLYYKNIYIEQPLEETISVETTKEEEFINSEKDFVNVAINKETSSEISMDIKIEQPQTEEILAASVLETVTDIESEAISSFELEEADRSENLLRNEQSAGLETSTDKIPNSKGPRFADTILQDKEENTKSPRLAEPNMDFNINNEQFIELENIPIDEAEEETLEEDLEEKQLEFDEEEAKRIINNSIKIGKMLNFSENELKELEQVSYYCNIGITKFKQRDLGRKNFRKMKILASYEMLMNDGTVPAGIAEIIKYCLNQYDCDTFPLNSKIPYYHIVAITSSYEDLLKKTNSKRDALLKMLQLGGNHFNIYILHKFINMMKDI